MSAKTAKFERGKLRQTVLNWIILFSTIYTCTINLGKKMQKLRRHPQLKGKKRERLCLVETVSGKRKKIQVKIIDKIDTKWLQWIVSVDHISYSPIITAFTGQEGNFTINKMMGNAREDLRDRRGIGDGSPPLFSSMSQKFRRMETGIH